jgi:hypothetical protein
MVWPPCFSLSHICPSMSRCSKNCETQSSNFGSGEQHPAVHANRARWLHSSASPTSSGQWPTPIRGRSGSRAIRSGARGRARIRAPRVSRRVTTREAVFAFWGFARIHLPARIYARRQELRAGFKAILGVIRSGADRRLAPAMINVGACGFRRAAWYRTPRTRLLFVHAPPINTPAPSTIAPPRTIWNTACRNGVSI